ncbi:hypothetical protein [Micromonospora endolithica]|uniref:Exo-alpha-sialidase n=1 Tax=Micromonospora endolithica TaxID=230091 RepID=A0A3A9ZF76_9ACTN|nr:hypothetical protein [Micromonospora endolithica]RKN46374.1 hypothetical protein D7223_15820 [Micromonospora endolithica]TWJ24887.1 hypothetical protein JD76_05045 [Micromonospora endolithica]
MRETHLDGVFADFEARTAPTFRPPGLAATGRRVRDRRRRRRGLLAGLAALLLAGPGGAYALAGRDGDDVPPTPAPASPSPSPGGPPVSRRIVVPGVAGELRELRFVDARHAWALFDTCDPDDDLASTDCRRDLARTEDGGASWRRIPLPGTANDPTPGSRPYLLVTDDQQVTLAVAGRFLVTPDGGTSFTEHPMTDPPPVTQRALGTRSGFLLTCPAPNRFTGRACDRQELIHAKRGRLPAQPPVDLGPTADRQLVEGRGGRLWLSVVEGDRMTVVVSDDQGLSWRKLPPVPGARRLLVSPNGADAWLVSVDAVDFQASATERVWSLEGDGWRTHVGLPDNTLHVAAVDGGRLVVTGAYGTVGFWTPAGYQDRPEVRVPSWAVSQETGIEVLRDGTIVLENQRSWTVGVGTGVERAWTRLS